MDGVVGLEALETGQNTKECGALSEWETTAAFTGSLPLCRGWGDGGQVFFHPRSCHPRPLCPFSQSSL